MLVVMLHMEEIMQLMDQRSKLALEAYGSIDHYGGFEVRELTCHPITHSQEDERESGKYKCQVDLLAKLWLDGGQPFPAVILLYGDSVRDLRPKAIIEYMSHTPDGDYDIHYIGNNGRVLAAMVRDEHQIDLAPHHEQ